VSRRVCEALTWVAWRRQGICCGGISCGVSRRSAKESLTAPTPLYKREEEREREKERERKKEKEKERARVRKRERKGGKGE